MVSLNFPHVYGKSGPRGGQGGYREAVPFDGEAPRVSRGDWVRCRDTRGDWHLRIAMGAPRYDHVHSIGSTYLTVPIVTAEEWASEGEDAHWINWPAEDVRAIAREAA